MRRTRTRSPCSLSFSPCACAFDRTRISSFSLVCFRLFGSCVFLFLSASSLGHLPALQHLARDPGELSSGRGLGAGPAPVLLGHARPVRRGVDALELARARGHVRHDRGHSRLQRVDRAALLRVRARARPRATRNRPRRERNLQLRRHCELAPHFEGHSQRHEFVRAACTPCVLSQ